jgi:hypothetical protein
MVFPQFGVQIDESAGLDDSECIVSLFEEASNLRELEAELSILESQGFEATEDFLGDAATARSAPIRNPGDPGGVFFSLSAAASGRTAGAWAGVEVGLQERPAIEKDVEKRGQFVAQARDGLTIAGNISLCHVTQYMPKHYDMSREISPIR